MNIWFFDLGPFCPKLQPTLFDLTCSPGVNNKHNDVIISWDEGTPLPQFSIFFKFWTRVSYPSTHLPITQFYKRNSTSGFMVSFRFRFVSFFKNRRSNKFSRTIAQNNLQNLEIISCQKNLTFRSHWLITQKLFTKPKKFCICHLVINHNVIN